ncbi:hypothetical protein BC829DRAFT_408211 [Chytridium lagenaria]|nr:hypothetical protein BC829DRAFT_408211 [Chytridium lagenaria]
MVSLKTILTAVLLVAASGVDAGKKCAKYHKKVTTVEPTATTAAAVVATTAPAPTNCYGAIPKPDETYVKVPEAIKDVSPAAVVGGYEKAPENVKPVTEAIKPSCSTNTTQVYNYGSSVIISGDEGNQTTRVACTVHLSCTGVEDGSHMYELQVKNVKLYADEKGDEATEIKDKELAKPYYFVRSIDGQVLGAYISEDEGTEAAALKKGITESFNTNFNYTNGKAKVEETGVTSDRTASYAAVNYNNTLYSIEAKYDDASIKSYVPGTESNDPSKYKAHTDCIVDKNGVIHSSYDRTQVSAQDKDGDGIADIKVYASSDITLVSEVPRVPSYGKVPATKLQSIKADEISKKTLERRSTAEVHDELLSHVHILAREPSNDAAADAVLNLAKREPEAASILISMSRRHNAKRDANGLNRRSGFHSLPKALIFSALAASESEEAHMHLAELALSKEETEADQDLARMALTFASRPSKAVVQRISLGSTMGSPNVLLLGSLVSSHEADFAHETMSPYITSLTNTTDAQALQTIHAIDNMGSNSLLAVDALLTTASDVRRPLQVRIAAIKSLKPFSHLPIIINELSLISQNSPSLTPTIQSITTPIITRRAIQDAIPKDWLPVTDKNWASTLHPTYETLLPIASRRADTSTYPAHAAGLVGLRAGFPQLGLTAAGGVFAGYTSTTCLVPDFKLYASAKANAEAFNRRFDILDAETVLTKSTSNNRITATGRVHVRFNGKTVVSQEIANGVTCSPLLRPVANLRTQVATYKIDLPIYVAKITVDITASASLKADVEAKPQCGPSTAANTAMFRPTVGASVSGFGTAKLWLLKGTMDVKGGLSYTLAPEVKVLSPQEGCRVCAAVNDAWEDSGLNVKGGASFGGSKEKVLNLVAKNVPARGLEPVKGLGYCINPKDLIKPKN